MKSMILRFTAILLVCLCLCAQVFAEEEDPVVVRAGKFGYTLSEAQEALNGYSDLALATGETLTEEEKQQIIDSLMDRLVGLAIIQNKLDEAGVNEFTEDEMEILTEEARRQYDYSWQELYRQTQEYAPDVTEEQITAFLAEQGYTVKSFLRELMVNERESRILDLYCRDVKMTDEEIRAYYEENFLNPDREKYAENIPLYEEEILKTDNESFYTPEGYRCIKNLQLDFPEDITTALGLLNLEGRKAVSEAQTAYNDLAAAAAAGEDTAPLKETYDEKMAAVHDLENRYRAKAAEAIPLLQETIDTIRSRLESGTSIETLLREYSTDQSQTGEDKAGVLYHADSTIWTEEAHAAIDAMTAPGQLSEPFVDTDGVHLAYYVSDYPGGERLLTKEENETLRSSALLYAKRVRLQELIDGWKADYEIMTDSSSLVWKEIGQP